MPSFLELPGIIKEESIAEMSPREASAVYLLPKPAYLARLEPFLPVPIIKALPFSKDLIPKSICKIAGNLIQFPKHI